MSLSEAPWGWAVDKAWQIYEISHHSMNLDIMVSDIITNMLYGNWMKWHCEHVKQLLKTPIQPFMTICQCLIVLSCLALFRRPSLFKEMGGGYLGGGFHEITASYYGEGNTTTVPFQWEGIKSPVRCHEFPLFYYLL